MTDLNPDYCAKCRHHIGYHMPDAKCHFPAEYGNCKCHKAESREECDFLNKYDPRKFPVITTTVDVVITRWVSNPEATGGHWDVVLIKRKNFPFKDRWALPGGFVDHDENTKAAARREVKEEAGLDLLSLRFLGVADKPDRDPRGRTISIVYEAEAKGEPFAGDDAVEAAWFRMDDALSLTLAFDHNEILVWGE